MEKLSQVTEKYERNGWPSLPRPDVKKPAGWDLSLVTAQERIRNHQLSPDGLRLAFIKDDGRFSDIYTLPVPPNPHPGLNNWPSRTSFERELVAYWDDEIPQWSPDGQNLAFCIHGHVYISDKQGQALPKKITDFTGSASSPRWMPDSNGLVISVTRHETDQLLLTDKAGTWPRQLTNSDAGDHWDAQPSPDGLSLAFTYRPFNDLNRLDICMLNLKAGIIHTVYGKPKTRAHDPRWSADGQWLAFLCQEAGRDDLWLVHPNGEGLRQISRLGCDIAQFAWSPDGSQLLVTVNRAGSHDLALLDPFSGILTDLRRGQGLHQNPNWSKNGQFITFEYESPIQPPEILRMDLSSRTVTQLTFSFIPALAACKLVTPEPVSFKSFDGLEIPAFLYRPARPNGAAVLFPHGGPSAQYGYEWDILAQYLVAKGYTYLALNYRGSTGYGLTFEHANYNDWGMGDTQDCLAGARYLGSLPWIDPQRLAIYGGSYGGYLTNCCLARDPEYLFACGIAKYGDANTLSSWALCKRDLRLYTEIFLGHPAHNREIYKKSCPILEASNIQKPILLLHGLEDDTVPPEASEEWAAQLRVHNKTFEYKTYAGEPHGFLRRENILDAYTRIERFLDWYLLPS
ncbi:MAG: S9 family peptidase [Chloroflexota bacterium]